MTSRYVTLLVELDVVAVAVADFFDNVVVGGVVVVVVGAAVVAVVSYCCGGCAVLVVGTAASVDIFEAVFLYIRTDYSHLNVSPDQSKSLKFII